MLREFEKRARKNAQRRRDAMNREMSALSKAAGITQHAGKRDTEAERGWMKQCSISVPDTRSLTGVIFGDPPRNDPRRTWCPWLQDGGADA